MTKLREAAGSKAVPDPTRHIVSAWNDDEWTKGAPLWPLLIGDPTNPAQTLSWV
jgi:hypothetical protein